ncbi:MAG: SET domain-containing protein [archaeon]
MPKNLLVQKSSISGKGVFAARDYRKGEVVVKWDLSKIISKSQAKKLSEEDKKFLVKHNGKYILMQAPAKFVNHSCDANTMAQNFCYVAKRDIKIGEEITTDYSETMSENDSFDCKCKSPNCKKKIVPKSQALAP